MTLNQSQNLILLLNEGYMLGSLKELTEAQVFFIYKFKEFKLGLIEQSKIPENHLTIKSGDSIDSMREMVKLYSNYKGD